MTTTTFNRARKIAVIDYGVGNLYSVERALKSFTENYIITEDPADIAAAQAIILPGVGAFGAGMEGLRRRGLVQPIKNFAQTGKLILGICLGAQILLSEGYEFGHWEGLGIIEGQTIPFSSLALGTKIPHIGWNILRPKKEDGWERTILAGLGQEISAYFVHSFILQPKYDQDINAVSQYGGREFTSVIRRENIYGCQFHPEKSGGVGLAIIRNFINLID
ncbi:MAG: imidazole glycerol phosphate synthase subunit HisH [Patescibacteria group bacterium]